MKNKLMAGWMVFFVIMVAMSIKIGANVSTDEYIRDRIVKLHSELGLCSGVIVKAPSGKDYILSAAHCADLTADGVISAKTEAGKDYMARIIEVDKEHDLMLLTTEQTHGIKIADKVVLHQHVRAMGHGAGMPTFKTEGEILEEKINWILSYPILGPWDINRCEKEGRKVVVQYDGMFCMFKLNSLMSTARVIPGMSGGPVVDDMGRLVGIASNSDNFFSGLVPLEDIQTFLATK